MTQKILKNQVSVLKPDYGIDQDSRKKMADLLMMHLSDTYRLLINTQGIHWNTQGPLFYSIHKLTEEQYEELFESIDVLAERIRALGYPAVQTLTQIADHSSIGDLVANGELDMQIKSLIELNESISTQMRKTIEIADNYKDFKTADLLTDRIGQHEHNIWMLNATIAS